MATATRGLILFGHGARDPRWREPFERLRDLVAAARPETTVSLAFLEMMAPDLDRAADALVAGGCVDLTIVPIFFGQGTHLRRDLPSRVDALRRRYPQRRIALAAAAGEDERVLEALADYCVRAAD